MSLDSPPALTVVLTEFQTIRVAIDRKATSLLTLVSLNVTAVATVVGFVLSANADQRLLLVLPVLTSCLGLLVYDLDQDIEHARRYISGTLQPLAAQYGGDDRLLAYAADAPRSRLHVIAAQGIPHGLLFPAVSAIALVVVVPKLGSFAGWAAWSLGAVLSLMLVAVWSTKLKKPASLKS